MKNRLSYLAIKGIFELLFFFVFFITGMFFLILKNNIESGYFYRILSYFVWLFLFYGLLYLSLKLLKINLKRFVFFSFAEGYKVLLIGGLLFGITSGIFKWNLSIPLNEKYIGEYTESEIGVNDFGDDVIARNQGYLYNIEYYKKSKNKETHHFLFWQTGYIEGYNIKYIESDMKRQAVALFLIAGLLTLIEYCILVIPFFLFYFLLAFIAGLFRKRLPYTDFLQFRKFVNGA